MVQKEPLSGIFSQVHFSEAAAAEVALERIGFSVEFVNDEIAGNTLSDTTDEIILELCKEHKKSLSFNIGNQISLEMNATKIHEINGMNRALDLFKDIVDQHTK
jgi:hypothetical protein